MAYRVLLQDENRQALDYDSPVFDTPEEALDHLLALDEQDVGCDWEWACVALVDGPDPWKYIHGPLH